MESFENSCSVFFFRLRKIRVIFFVLFVFDDGNENKKIKRKKNQNQFKVVFVSSDQTGG